MYLGKFNNGQNITANLDDLQIWKGVRTQSQIQSDMNSRPVLNSLNLLAYYDFNDVSANSDTNLATGPSAYGASLDAASATASNFQENSVSDTTTVAIRGYTVIKFTKNYLTANGGWKVPSNITSVDYLVVGGGGGAGYNSGGGGSGGGFETGTLNVSYLNVAVNIANTGNISVTQNTGRVSIQ